MCVHLTIRVPTHAVRIFPTAKHIAIQFLQRLAYKRRSTYQIEQRRESSHIAPPVMVLAVIKTAQLIRVGYFLC